MSWHNHPDFWSLIGALIISIVSGFISIARRILNGHPSSILWIISEFMTAILCGYLMYHAYPIISPSLPEVITLPVAIAVSAHIGGRIFQELEATIIDKYKLLLKG